MSEGGRVLAGGTRIGRYEVLSPLGAGGMGEVYRVRDTRLGREVALKVLGDRLGGDGRTIALFEQEARLAGSLDHPNVLAVHDLGDHEGKPYLVSELLEGETLRERLQDGPLPQAAALAIALQIARGLDAAHQKGIVHRDLKPENVFLTRDGRAKILDFGIAKLLPAAREPTGTDHQPSWRTIPGSMIGTPAYMSPEQVRGEQVDARSDLFSLGSVLYEMLAGRHPFSGDTAMEQAAAVLHGESAPLPAGVPQRLARAVLRCLAKAPEDRFQSAHDLIAELQTVPGAPIGSAARVPRRALAWGTIAVVSVAGGLAGWLLLRRPAPITHASAPPPSIAVLPFADLSPQKDQEYFSDGLAEELLNALAHVEGLRVAGRTSSFSFKGKHEDLRSIGQKLGVAHVLEGSVRKAGSRVRVTAQLVGVDHGFHLWSQTYDRDLTDIFAVQDEIARAVVEALRVRLAPGKDLSNERRRTPNPEVYNQYLLGRQLYGRRSAEGARYGVEAYEKALALDPGYAPAWAGLAYALADHADGPVTTAGMEENRRRAVAAAEKAVALDPGLVDGYAARAYMRGFLAWDWTGAQADLQRALAINPGDARTHRIAGRLAAVLGRQSQAIAAMLKATDLDPLDAEAWGRLGRLYMFDGHFDLATRAFDRALQIAPDSGSALFARGTLFLVTSQPQRALDTYQRIRERMWQLWGIALAQHALGHPRESDQALEALLAGFQHSAAYQIALVHGWRGERDLAFEWLERAYSQRHPRLSDLTLSVLTGHLRGDPRYANLLKRMNLQVD